MGTEPYIFHDHFPYYHPALAPWLVDLTLDAAILRPLPGLRRRQYLGGDQQEGHPD